jgi:two-component system, OmpR family, sensor kinase
VRSGHVSAAQDGAGLGLAIVQAVAEAHGGTVELASDAGLGATFTIILPAPTD